MLLAVIVIGFLVAGGATSLAAVSAMVERTGLSVPEDRVYDRRL